MSRGSQTSVHSGRARSRGRRAPENEVPKARTIISIPLKNQVDAELVDEKSVHKAFANEYSTKLLESIGATPTKANMELVRKMIPLSETCVKVSCKTRGALVDQIDLTVPSINYEVKLQQKAGRAKPHEVLALGMLQNVEQLEPEVESAGDRLFKQGRKTIEDPEKGLDTFEEMGGKYLYPFKILNDPDLDPSVAMPVDAPGAASTSGRPPIKSGRRIGKDSEERSKGTSKKSDFVKEEILQELNQNFHVNDAAVLHCQTAFETSLLEWKDGLAEDTLTSRITPEDFQMTISELSSDSTVRLFRTTATCFYHMFIRNISLDDAQQEKAVFTIHQDYATICRRYRRRKSHFLFTLPVLLLSMRVMVDRLFTTSFPNWASSEEGKDCLLQMDEMISVLFDPHDYHSEISLLQSAPGAMKIMQKYRGRAHKPIHSRFYDLSPLTKAVVGKASSAGARVLLAKENAVLKKIEHEKLKHGYKDNASGDETSKFTKLSQSHRRKLYKIAQSVHGHTHPYQGAEYASSDRSGWLFTESYSGSAGT
ncbi:hypothetical protein CYMTET_25951 [Cymbomonas tetramitiformis]|uniref:Uncharacterized protein n=1 Tax=Cymbomonas tetramitiformis TaxID=36881 RepID=A0AAE0FT27_9CHLO|nr:hypothetical protein CYMTET_25951 [Cymbomonas tetramitiformis]